MPSLYQLICQLAKWDFWATDMTVFPILTDKSFSLSEKKVTTLTI